MRNRKGAIPKRRKVETFAIKEQKRRLAYTKRIGERENKDDGRARSVLPGGKGP